MINWAWQTLRNAQETPKRLPDSAFRWKATRGVWFALLARSDRPPVTEVTPTARTLFGIEVELTESVAAHGLELHIVSRYGETVY